MSRWAAAFNAIREGGTHDAVDTVAGNGTERPHSVNCVNSVSHPASGNSESAVDAADEPGPWPEPELPLVGTSERDRLDRRHPAEVRGYTRAALVRPVSWAEPNAVPSPGCFCRNCAGRQWWCELAEPKGWRCASCHPGTHLPTAERREVRT